ncbi:hypothetical protein DFH06DRAFT_1124339 [Mycena polygramma]|nr:hypothetical protein DFH06DRAFT_1124339 [Mycena polygramma]
MHEIWVVSAPSRRREGDWGGKNVGHAQGWRFTNPNPPGQILDPHHARGARREYDRLTTARWERRGIRGVTAVDEVDARSVMSHKEAQDCGSITSPRSRGTMKN